MTMTQEIKLTTDQMKLMSLFQNITKATARDCIEDEKRDRIIFVVNEGKMGLIFYLILILFFCKLR